MIRNINFILFTFFIITVRAGFCGAGEEQGSSIVTDRPDFTESAETIPCGMVQIELGYTFGSLPDADNHTFGELLARIPVLKHVEIRMGLNSFVVITGRKEDQSGVQDASLGFKAKFFERHKLDLAILAGTSLPTGQKDFGEKKLRPALTLAAASPFTDDWSMGSNVGLISQVENGERFLQGTFSLSSGYSVSNSSALFLEYYGIFPGSKDGADAQFLNGGITYLINNNFQLDARIGTGLNGISSEYFMGLGTGIRF